MKAQLVEYSYETGSWDACKGSSSWTESAVAILIPELNLLIVKSQWDRMYFFIVSKENEKWQFRPRDFDRNLPEQGFQVLKEIEVPDELARTAVVFAVQLQSFRDARMKFDELLKSETKIFWQEREQRKAKETATASPA